MKWPLHIKPQAFLNCINGPNPLDLADHFKLSLSFGKTHNHQYIAYILDFTLTISHLDYMCNITIVYYNNLMSTQNFAINTECISKQSGQSIIPI